MTETVSGTIVHAANPFVFTITYLAVKLLRGSRLPLELGG
jgi:hypothetical protein